MKKLFYLVLFSLFLIFLPAYGEEEYEDTVRWILVAPYSYINPDTVVRMDNGNYSFMLKSLNKGQFEPVNGRDIHHTITRYEINCANYSYKIGVIDSYDKWDNFVNGDYNKFAKFQSIVGGTAVSVIADKLCKI